VPSCSDLVEDDVDDGRGAPLPELSDAQWSALLDAPAFRMATSMKSTQAARGASPREGGPRDAAGVDGAGGSGQPEEGGASEGDDDDEDDDDDDADVDDVLVNEAACCTGASKRMRLVDGGSCVAAAACSSTEGAIDALAAQLRCETGGSSSRRATGEGLASAASMGSAEAAAVAEARAGRHFAAEGGDAVRPMSKQLRTQVRSDRCMRCRHAAQLLWSAPAGVFEHPRRAASAWSGDGASVSAGREGAGAAQASRATVVRRRA
jgi:hypothetical protein